MMIKPFAELLKYPFVIIYDTANGNKLHRTDCSYVTKENYNLKVIINYEKNGYYEPLQSLTNIDETTIKSCKVCKPTQL
jgi:hypothetical protein